MFNLAPMLLWTERSPEEVDAAIAEAVQQIRLVGTHSEGRFVGRARTPGTKNSWRPALDVRWRPAGEGTVIHVDLTLPTVVVLFTLVHGLLLFGIAWAMGIAATIWGRREAERVLIEATAGRVTTLSDIDSLVALADPEDPGAEVNSPPSLGARVSPDGVRFGPVGDGTWPWVSQTYLTVRAQGIEPGGRVVGVRREILWDEIGAIQTVEPSEGRRELVVLDRSGRRLVAFPLTHETEVAYRWLETYLRARLVRGRASFEEMEQVRGEAQRLVGTARGQGTSA